MSQVREFAEEAILFANNVFGLELEED